MNSIIKVMKRDNSRVVTINVFMNIEKHVLQGVCLNHLLIHLKKHLYILSVFMSGKTVFEL